MSNRCPVCKRAKCKWIELKDPKKVKTIEELEQVVDHNLSVIEMLFRDNTNGSAHAEERMYAKLNPYTEEIERRKSNGGKL